MNYNLFSIFTFHIFQTNILYAVVSSISSNLILPDVIILKNVVAGGEINREKLIIVQFYLQHVLHPEHTFLRNNKPVSSWCLSHPHLSTYSARSVSVSFITFQPFVWSFEVDFNLYSCHLVACSWSRSVDDIFQIFFDLSHSTFTPSH
jgi:hypothetical protein